MSEIGTLVVGGQALTIRVSRGRRSAIVAVGGESDADSAQRLGRELGALWSRCTLVVPDCAGLRFLGPSGLTAVLDAHVRARSRGNVLRLVVSTPAVLAVLHVSGADRELAVFRSMNDALTT